MIERKKRIKAVFLAFAFLFYCTLSSAEETQTESRTALVIGNSAYEEPLLSSAVNALEMKNALESLGFTVLFYTDLDLTSMIDILQNFTKTASESDTCLLYFSGYTYQTLVDGYMLPANTIANSEEDIVQNTISLSDISTRLARTGCKRSFMFLDTVSYTSFLEEDEVPKELRIPPETKDMSGVYSFGTLPYEIFTRDETRSTPFTESLVKNLAQKGQDIRLLYGTIATDAKDASDSKQVLQTGMTLLDEYCFIPKEIEISAEDSPASEEDAARQVSFARINELLVQKAEQERMLATAERKNKAALVLGGVGVCAAVVSGLIYLIGSSSMKEYEASVITETVDAKRIDTEIYSRVCSGSLIVFGTSGIGALLTYFLPPFDKTVRQNITNIDKEIQSLSQEPEAEDNTEKSAEAVQ